MNRLVLIRHFSPFHKQYAIPFSTSKMLQGEKSSTSNKTDDKMKKYVVSKSVLAILSKYKEIVGDLCVSSSFKVPKKDPWPMAFHGYTLGKELSIIEQHNECNTLSAKSFNQLEKLGLQWKFPNHNNLKSSQKDGKTRRISKFEHKKEALITYKRIHGDLLVSRNYIIPTDDLRYAPHLHGMKLGHIVSHIRNRNDYSKHRAELVALGFHYETQLYTFEKVIEALIAYKIKYGDLLVPFKYVIPEKDPHFAKDLWGMLLGYVVNDIRNSDTYINHKAQLLDMGFQYENIRRPPNFAHVKEALVTYKRIHGGFFISQKYMVPYDDPRYASHLHGMKLGFVAYFIRKRNSYSKHREELLAIGFPYEN